MTGTSENNETTTSLSTLILFVISLAVCGVFFILVLLIFCMLKKKPKLSSNKIHRSGKDATESESTYEDVGKVSTQMEMSKNVAYGCALKT